jgi:hypothetical protein
MGDQDNRLLEAGAIKLFGGDQKSTLVFWFCLSSGRKHLMCGHQCQRDEDSG